MDNVIDVKDAIKELERLNEQLSRKQIARVAARAINRTLMKGRTVARKAVKDVYNIPQMHVNNIDIKRASPNKLMGYIFAPTKVVPLNAFKPVFQTQTKTIRTSKKGVQTVKDRKRRNKSAGAGVTVEVQRGKRSAVSYAFMIPGAKPHVFARGGYHSGGVTHFIKRNKRERKDGTDIHINPLMSITTYQAVINKKSISVIKDKVQSDFPQELRYQLNYAIARATRASGATGGPE